MVDPRAAKIFKKLSPDIILQYFLAIAGGSARKIASPDTFLYVVLPLEAKRRWIYLPSAEVGTFRQIIPSERECDR